MASVVFGKATMRRAQLVWLSLAAALSVAAFAWIRPLVQRSKQIQTYAVLQSMGHEVERLPQKERSRENIERVISKKIRGRDAWGNAVQVYVVTGSRGMISYVLVSTGSDGRGDVTSTNEYFRMIPTDIRRQTERDIVYRDGRMITFAGK